MKLKCFFCQNSTTPDYKTAEVLAKFTSDRGKILGRDKGGACAKHQRQLTTAIKRARHLALLPFVA
jgi:small subunit ribosomal protein S18